MTFSNVIECSGDRLKLWLQFINPAFHLSKKELSLLGNLITSFIEISKSQPDEWIANKLLFSTESRKAIKEKMKIKNNYFDVLLNRLKKQKVVLESGEYDNRKIRLNKKVIPKADSDGNINLLVLFR